MSQTSRSTASDITSFSHEERVFPPPAEFAAGARISSLEEYRKIYDRSVNAPEEFWAEQATAELVWLQW